MAHRNLIPVFLVVICIITRRFIHSFSVGNLQKHGKKESCVIGNEKAFADLATCNLPNNIEERLEELATNTLLPVFFSGQNEEKELRKCLRNLSTDISRQEREYLSKLILRTSIFRIQHVYALRPTNVSIRGAEFLALNSTTKTTPDERKQFVSQMVHLQARNFNNSNNDWNHWNDQITHFGLDNIAWKFSIKNSLSLWIAKLWIDQYGIDEAQSLAEYSNNPGPITLRQNYIKSDLDQNLFCEELKKQDNVIVQPIVRNNTIHAPKWSYRLISKTRSIWSMITWQKGWWEVQDLGSQIIVQSTMDCLEFCITKQPHRDEQQQQRRVFHILDYCAGNGGKTLALASTCSLALKQNQDVDIDIHIWAHDIETLRLKQIKGSLPRAGFDQCSNGTVWKAFEKNIYIHIVEELPPSSFDQFFDVVLVDAPCSSMGVLRRRPSQRWILEEKQIKEDLPKLQLDILMNASKLAKESLVYATCSILKQENQDVADSFFNLQKCNIQNKTLLQWKPWPLLPNESNATNPHYRTLLPHIHDTDGFFIARWKKCNAI